MKFAKQASHFPIYKATRKRPTPRHDTMYCMHYTQLKETIEMFVSDPPLDWKYKFPEYWLILDMVANEGEYGLIQYSWMRINAKLLSAFMLFQLIIICQPFSYRENSYVGKIYSRRKISIQLHQTRKSLGNIRESSSRN